MMLAGRWYCTTARRRARRDLSTLCWRTSGARSPVRSTWWPRANFAISQLPRSWWGVRTLPRTRPASWALVDISAGRGRTSAPRPGLHVSCTGVRASEDGHDRQCFLRTRTVEPAPPAVFQPNGRPPQVVGWPSSSSSRTPDPGRRLRTAREGKPRCCQSSAARQIWALLWRGPDPARGRAT